MYTIGGKLESGSKKYILAFTGECERKEIAKEHGYSYSTIRDLIFGINPLNRRNVAPLDAVIRKAALNRNTIYKNLSDPEQAYIKELEIELAAKASETSH